MRGQGWVGGVLLGLTACAPRSAPAPRPPDAPPAVATGTSSEDEIVPGEALDEAEQALQAGALARAVALFGRALASEGARAEELERAYLGLASAHERLGDCGAAILAYETFLRRVPESERKVVVLARQGACEAEIEQWERSAATFEAITREPEQLPSVLVEAYARQGYALFNAERWDDADAALLRADEVYRAAEAAGTERFASHYFVGMARFYRAAILHVRFRATKIELPEKAMEVAFKRKLELLNAAQEAYHETIRAQHMFWVSAAGFQLGHLFSELYDDLMYAPVPEWLDERQRQIYYRELKKQLQPVFQKAVWVFEKNLETARRIGYESPFIEQTQAKLAHIQAALHSDDADLGRPHPRLTDEGDVGDRGVAGERWTANAEARPPAPPAERDLFVPPATPL